MKTNLLILAVCSLLMTACADSDSSPTKRSVDTDGNCTSEFVMDYNNVVFEARRSNNETVLQNACTKFYSHHNPVSCRAEINYKAEMVNTETIDKLCGKKSVSTETNKSSTSTTVPEVRKEIVVPVAVYGVYPNGDCAPNLVSDFKKFYELSKIAQIDLTEKSIKPLKNHCDLLIAEYGKASCTYNDKEIDFSAVISTCETFLREL